ncbi:glycogen synthase GlgA [Chrysiogenes arsenatis]|uniref:glycogen synthase GlgA n=1 Tax=Chrysiogenes arsenatis TaxID=309797 RepID=UPI0004272E12|nr:glycogen synthase GlgA [Chrysiogenes arsenatis]
MKQLQVLFLASEVDPFAKTGGLADVCGALPKALSALKVDVKVVLPLYGSIDRKKYAIQLVSNHCVHMGNCEEWFSLHTTSRDGVDFYFIEFDKFFGRHELYNTKQGEFSDNPFRFAFFGKAALQVARDIGFKPDIIHCNDWQTGLVPAHLAFDNDLFFADTRCIFTIHNIGYQGIFRPQVLAYAGIPLHHFHQGTYESFGAINFLKGAIILSDIVTTVSPTYAREICGPIGSAGMHDILRAKGDRLIGILNGIDTAQWSPATDTRIPKNYTVTSLAGKAVNKAELQRHFLLHDDPNIAVFGFVGRFAQQKGMELLRDAVEQAVVNMACQIVIVGSGETEFERFFGELPRFHPGKIGSHIGYSEDLAHLVEAGSDFFLMPSLYEPCGLNQMYSLAYGTLPVVRATGGLEDTVENYNEVNGTGTGFKFSNISASALYNTMGWAVSTFYDRPAHYRAMQQQAMAQDFGWKRSAQSYYDVYQSLIEKKS